MLKFKTGDTIKVTIGKDKGREGKVEKIYASDSKALVPGLNMYKKHVKGRQGQKGGIYDLPRPLSFAKIALVCPNCKKPTRTGFRVVGNEKVRLCRKCGKELKS